jgi:hypothetical protein
MHLLTKIFCKSHAICYRIKLLIQDIVLKILFNINKQYFLLIEGQNRLCIARSGAARIILGLCLQPN